MYKSLVDSVFTVNTCSTQCWLFFHCCSIFMLYKRAIRSHPEGSLLLLYSFIKQVAILFTSAPSLGPWKWMIQMWDFMEFARSLDSSRVESPSNRLSNSTQREATHLVPSISKDLHSNNWATFSHDPERLLLCWIPSKI
jgi:hypothetical protein